MFNMRCPRCGSIMAYEKFFHQTECFWGWKCVFCGECIDQVIWENRQYQKKIQKNKRKKKGEGISESFLDMTSVFNG